MNKIYLLAASILFCCLLTSNLLVAQNDNFCDAISLTVGALNTPGDCGAAFPYDNTAATIEASEPLPVCFSDGTLEASVWFTFTAPASGYVTATTDITGSVNTDTQIAVYEYTGPACPASDLTLLTEVGCDDDGGTIVNFNSVITNLVVTPGGTYYVQVDGWQGTAGAFCLDIYETDPPPPPPANNDCATAQNIPGTINTPCRTGTTINALPSSMAALPSCDQAGTNGDVFYTFIASSTNMALEVLAGTNIEMTLWDQCVTGAIGTEIPGACFNNTNAGDPINVFTGLTVGTQYVLQIWTDSNVGNDSDFEFCLGPAPDATCGDAICEPGVEDYLSCPADCPCVTDFYYISYAGGGPALSATPEAFCLEFFGGTSPTPAVYCIPFVFESQAPFTDVDGDGDTDYVGSTLSSAGASLYTFATPNAGNVVNDPTRFLIYNVCATAAEIQANGISVNFTDASGDCNADLVLDIPTLFPAGLEPDTDCLPCEPISGTTVTSPICANETFTVNIANCVPFDQYDDFLLIYDIDTANAAPTDADLYDYITGATTPTDLVNFGEFSMCDGAGFVDLQGFANPSCDGTSDFIELYIMPIDVEGNVINAACDIDGPVTLEILPGPGIPGFDLTSCVYTLTGICPDDVITLDSGSSAGSVVTGDGTGTFTYQPAPGDALTTLGFTLTNSAGVCSLPITLEVEEFVAMNLTCPSAYCELDPADAAAFAYTVGGSISGPGVIDNLDGTASFDPAAAGTGTHTVTATITDVNGCESIQTCEVIVNAVPTSCDDGDCSNGVETVSGCDCVPGTPPVDPGCDDGDCSNGLETWDGCECVAGTPAMDPGCDDGDCTNGVETFDGCDCVAGTPPVDPGCDDGDCTNGLETWDGCDCVAGTAPVDPGCDDGDCSNGVETWDGCECVAGTAPVDPGCDDGDCTNGLETWDGCECVAGTPAMDPGCDDGDCTNGVETWDGCDCVAGTAPVDPGCDDGDCANGVETWDGCECVAGTAPVDPGCDDGDCTNGVETWDGCDCVAGTAPVDPGCDDGDCSNGVETWDGCDCVAGTAPVDPGCDDGDCSNGVETWDGCDCVAGTAPVDPGCDDGQCSNGVETWDGCDCVAGTPPEIPDCNDNDCNTADVYNIQSCMCENNPITPNACDDGDCNTEDSYDDVACVCVNTPIPPPDCDDNDCNTADSYDQFACECVNDPIPPLDCDDNDCNTADSYDAATCSCINDPIAPLDCDDNDCSTADSYDAATCSCINDPIIQPVCDTDPCTNGGTYVYNAATCQCDLVEATVTGCSDPSALNYDAAVNCLDINTCIYQPSAGEFNCNE